MTVPEIDPATFVVALVILWAIVLYVIAFRK